MTPEEQKAYEAADAGWEFGDHTTCSECGTDCRALWEEQSKPVEQRPDYQCGYDAGYSAGQNTADAEWFKNIHDQLDRLGAPKTDIDGNGFSINGRFALLESGRSVERQN